jgi:preprotein translocase subunit Sec63
MQRGKAILRAMPDAKIDPLPKGVEFIRTRDRANTGTFRYTAFSATVREAFLRVGTRFSFALNACFFVTSH